MITRKVSFCAIFEILENLKKWLHKKYLEKFNQITLLSFKYINHALKV